MGKIVWSPVARADLEAIADYIAKDSPARAAVFVDRLIDAASPHATVDLIVHAIDPPPRPSSADYADARRYGASAFARPSADESRIEHPVSSIQGPRFWPASAKPSGARANADNVEAET